jgi:hypothetical protein
MALTALRALYLGSSSVTLFLDAEGVAVLGRVFTMALTALRTLELNSETVIFCHAFLYARVLEEKCSIVNVYNSRCRLPPRRRLCCIVAVLDSANRATASES